MPPQDPTDRLRFVVFLYQTHKDGSAVLCLEFWFRTSTISIVIQSCQKKVPAVGLALKRKCIGHLGFRIRVVSEAYMYQIFLLTKLIRLIFCMYLTLTLEKTRNFACLSITTVPDALKMQWG
jgi:hypothetical protein